MLTETRLSKVSFVGIDEFFTKNFWIRDAQTSGYWATINLLTLYPALLSGALFEQAGINPMFCFAVATIPLAATIKNAALSFCEDLHWTSEYFKRADALVESVNRE